MLDVRYRAARQRVADVVSTLSDDQLRTPVPATPGWTVHDVLAHLVGGAADLSSGRLDGAPGDAWTARHVGERRHQSVAELLAEWERVAPGTESALAQSKLSGPNLAGDVIGHEADLREALRLPRPDRAHWQPVLEVMMALLARRLRTAPRC
ncbi:hypothetical protein C1Y40_02277 [Mycobacterium talmoniae]|uniref:Mycothiol-dependent maleylpyruvate isomerase metal-binding domain-containing protein n=1 Tax=Mycobacterium talmoniae TaxID=1858794 RepID=A0A2S8BLM0_9MYCO|nr:hypothetical protein C1Y40_02277 [Mycobacterium talmoniae]